MSAEKTCAVCTKSLVNRRSHTKTCSGCCRTKLHRMSRARPISLKLTMSKLQFDSLKSQADSLGLLINQLVISRAFQPITNIGV